MEEIVIKGIVEAVLPKGEFRVKLEETGTTVHCRPSGKMRKNYIKMTEGDKVMVKVTPYDITKGLIVYRGWKN